MNKTYDVIIAGGGLAGLTLSIQLKQANPDITILILESRKGSAPIAAHKVGESTVELATHYYREVLNLKDYLEEFELPKHGLRFFFKNNSKEDISSRVELGPRLKLPTPSHQLDRGTFENHLEKLTKELGTDITLGTRVRDVNFSESGHEVIYSQNGDEHSAFGKWVVDATSRFSLLKKKLKFEKEAPHDVNAVWWRVKGVIDIDEWSENEKWKNLLAPKLRYLSTVHFLDTGYWLWVIPLGSQNTSIGIVADEKLHPFDTLNTYEKAVEWVRKNEPLALSKVCPPKDELMDFRILKHFAHDSKRIYSSERWAVTGESGAFLDPFYSPGSDFISLNNTWLSDLILRDLAGEDITFRSEVYEQTHLRWFRSWLPIYQDKYQLMGNTQIMVVKIFWDWAIYWSVPCLLFTNKGFTNIEVLNELFMKNNGAGLKFQELNKRMQDLFVQWLPYETTIFSNRYIDPFDLNYMRKFQEGITTMYNQKELIAQISDNVKTLEQIAASIFRLVSHKVKQTPLDMMVNPYTISLTEAPDTSSEKALLPDEAIRKDVEVMWFHGIAANV